MEKTLETNSQRKPSALPARAGSWFALLLAMMMATLPLSASALWSDTRELSVGTLSAATVTPVGTPSCTDNPGLLGILLPSVTLSWTAVPEAEKYDVVMILDGDPRSLGTVNKTNVDIDMALLDKVLGSLVGLLIGLSQVDIYVYAIGQNDWVSAASEPVKIRNASVLVLGGLKCVKP